LDKELGELAAGGPLAWESWEETKESWVKVVSRVAVDMTWLALGENGSLM